MKIDRRHILVLSMFTLVCMPLLGVALIRLFSQETTSIIIRQSSPFYIQVLYGLGLGLVMGLSANWLSKRPFIEQSTEHYRRKFAGLSLNKVDMLTVSICAGFGEELLFRGAIQHFWGVWPTAVFFVAIHGYLSFKDWRISIYGLTMTIFIAILGYMTEMYGIWTAILAHAMIDLVLLLNMQNQNPEASVIKSSSE